MQRKARTRLKGAIDRALPCPKRLPQPLSPLVVRDVDPGAPAATVIAEGAIACTRSRSHPEARLADSLHRAHPVVPPAQDGNHTQHRAAACRGFKVDATRGRPADQFHHRTLLVRAVAATTDTGAARRTPAARHSEADLVAQ